MTGLVGFSLSRVAFFDPWIFSIGGALIGFIAVIIGSLTWQRTHVFERKYNRRLLGLRVGVIGGCVALFGWLIGVFFSHKAGWSLGVIGVLTGFIGIAIHVFFLLRTHFSDKS